ncbi:MAG: hypothetical protein WC845_02690 [Candidatus Staskawiczbacteria bacterium]|jgi:type II secretory pathway component GspD/PulD (secretin)
MKRGCFYYVSAFIVAFAIVGSAMAQQSTSAPAGAVASDGKVVIAGQPGDYNIISSDGQLTMQSYEVTGVSVESKSTLYKAFHKLLSKDGRGGSAEVAPLTRNGKEIILLIVAATPEMQRSIAKTVERINSGTVGAFCYTPKNVVFIPKYRSAESIAAALRVEITNIGVLYVDPILNAITIEDDATYVDWLVNYAQEFDSPPPQITAILRLVAIDKNNDSSVGTDWGALLDGLPPSISLSIGGERQILSRSGEVSVANGDPSLALTGSKQRLSHLPITSFSAAVNEISPQAVGAFFSYLETKGVCRILNTADINVVNGSPTVVSTEVSMPVTATVSSETGGKLRQEVSVLEGVKITISGSLATIGHRLNVQASSTSVVSYTRTGLPLIATSTLDTAVQLPRNRTITLSGLSRQKEVTVTHKPPVLGDLDVLNLFSKKVTETREWKLYICITVVDPPVATPATTNPSVSVN